MRSKKAFAAIPADTWRHQSNRHGQRLLKRVTYDQIIAKIVDEARVVFHKRERARKNTEYFRALVTIEVHPSTVDLFHSSASGYRAQYYHSVALGEFANRYAIQRLVPRVLDLLKGHEKHTCQRPWLEMSLGSDDAKVWIHQGHWIRYARAEDRILRIERWVHEESCCPDPEGRKKARYAALTPSAESRIDLKGAFFTLTGQPLGTLKPTRAWDIHDLGFT